MDVHVLAAQTATLRPMNDRTSALSRTALSRSAPPSDYFSRAQSDKYFARFSARIHSFAASQVILYDSESILIISSKFSTLTSRCLLDIEIKKVSNAHA